MKRIYFIAILAILFIFSPLLTSANQIPTPTISEINSDIKSFDEIFVSGYTPSNSKALLYLDGNFIGEAQNIYSNGVEERFVYKIDFLPEQGQHVLFAIAQGLNSLNLSAQTKPYQFVINKRLAQPKIYSVEQLDETNFKIIGQTVNNSQVNIYIGNSFIKSTEFLFAAGEDLSFSEVVSLNLPNSEYLLSIESVDRVGRASIRSEIYNFRKSDFKPSQPIIENSITQPIVETEIIQKNQSSQPTKGHIETVVEDINKENKPSEDNVTLGGVDNGDDNKLDILDILNPDSSKGTTSTTTGNINDSEERQNKLNLNLIIFAGFLVAVILWIVWVNKELIKERQEEDNKDETEKFE